MSSSVEVGATVADPAYAASQHVGGEPAWEDDVEQAQDGFLHVHAPAGIGAHHRHVLGDGERLADLVERVEHLPAEAVDGHDERQVAVLEVVERGERVLDAPAVDEHDRTEGPYYVRAPFDAEPGWGVASVNYDLAKLLERAS